jgi:hypothetical protein
MNLYWFHESLWPKLTWLINLFTKCTIQLGFNQDTGGLNPKQAQAMIQDYVLTKTFVNTVTEIQMRERTPCPESASELYRPSDHRLSAKLVLTFADRGYRVISTADPYGRILHFLDRSRYFFFQVAPQLYPWGWVEPVPDPLILRNSLVSHKQYNSCD